MKKDFKDKKAIFVDYFDTLVIRKIKVEDFFLRWAYLLKKKYLALAKYSEEELVKIRKAIIYDYRNDYQEVPYDVVLKELLKRVNLEVNSEEFIQVSYNIEIEIECGCQYLNKKLYNFLKKEKEEGKKLYLVSDYHLDNQAYSLFMKNLNIDLFDKIFVSGNYNLTKRRGNGELYTLALKETNLKAEEVIMLGDNYLSDVKSPSRLGIKALHYKKKVFKFNHFHYSNKFLNYKKKEWKQSLYGEYSFFFYVFIERLYKEAVEDKVKKLVFLSREGLFLKKLFDYYLLVKGDKKIETFYIYNSRKLNNTLVDNDEYKEYLTKYLDGEYLNIVDSGWNNSMQEKIASVYKFKTRGYYIGTFSKNKLAYECKRKGLIYDIDSDGSVSDYYWSLRVNFTLIEQLLAANHGSVVSYQNKEFAFYWDEKEKNYYYKYIEAIQKQLFNWFKQLCVWDNGKETNKQLARMFVKSGLFANKERIKFLIESDNAYFDNNSNGQFRAKFSANNTNLISKIVHPERKLSLYVKKQRRTYDKKYYRKLYFVWASNLYLYLLFLRRI